MKIQDLITLEKKKSKNQKYSWETQIKLAFEKKKGYYWDIPSHSQDESILLNNYERDCVIAYIENKYFIVFLIKIRGKDNFKVFIYLKDFLKSVMGSYTYKISQIYSENIFKAFKEDEENLKIIENEEYRRFIKLGILENLG